MASKEILIISDFFKRSEKIINDLEFKNSEIIILLGGLRQNNITEDFKLLKDLQISNKVIYLPNDEDLINCEIYENDSLTYVCSKYILEQNLCAIVNFYNFTKLIACPGGIDTAFKRPDDFDRSLAFFKTTPGESGQIRWDKVYDGRFGYAVSLWPSEGGFEWMQHGLSIGHSTKSVLAQFDKSGCKNVRLLGE